MTSRYVESSQSGHELPNSHRRRRYRFKSYMEANTMEREHFESMQEAVSTKIEEVMASFRQDKLVVHRRQDEPEIVAQPVPPVPAKPSGARGGKNWWPWSATAVLAGLVVWLIWQDQNVGQEGDAVPESEPALARPATPAPAPPLEAKAAAPQPSAMPLAIEKTAAGGIESPSASGVGAPLVDSTAARAPADASAKDDARRPVQKSRAKSRSASSGPVEHYSEDLTNLLQGGK